MSYNPSSNSSHPANSSQPDNSISVKNISKCYQIYDRPQDRLKQVLFRGRRKYYREFWALQHVSFDITRGQTIGIIGRNGSGKSTILQIIAKTLTPTSGGVQVNGRVAALLELGSGFNPDFSGRDNVIMSCTIMGLSMAEIQRRMPDIEQFAEIGDFIDQPVKVYSSGMYLRLAFASAINVDPDILIIDEALAVGDMQFQLKCMDKMKAFKQQNKTILFVSHDSYTIRNFCDHVIWMKHGQIHMRGDANKVVEHYQDEMKAVEVNPADTSATPKRKDVLSIEKVSFATAQGVEQKTVEFAESFSVIADYTLHVPLEGIVGGIAIYDQQDNYICGLNTKLDQVTVASKPGQYQLILAYEQMNLMPGTYYIDIGFYESSAVIPLDYRRREDTITIISGKYFGEGLIHIQHQWQIRGRGNV